MLLIFFVGKLKVIGCDPFQQGPVTMQAMNLVALVYLYFQIAKSSIKHLPIPVKEVVTNYCIVEIGIKISFVTVKTFKIVSIQEENFLRSSARFSNCTIPVSFIA